MPCRVVQAIGFPIPLIPGIELVEPSVFFATGYMGLASDFSFNITAAADTSAGEFGQPEEEYEYPTIKIDLDM